MALASVDSISGYPTSGQNRTDGSLEILRQELWFPGLEKDVYEEEMLI